MSRLLYQFGLSGGSVEATARFELAHRGFAAFPSSHTSSSAHAQQYPRMTTSRPQSAVQSAVLALINWALSREVTG